jgi:hypothetical protein
VVALYGRARRGWSSRPDRAGGGRLAPPMPQGGPPSPRHRWPPPTGLPAPLYLKRRLRPAFREGPRGSRPSPQAVPKAGPGVEAPGCRSRLSAHIAEMLSLHDTTGHVRYPAWEPCQFRLVAWSPSLARVAYPRALRVSPYGQHDEMMLRFHHPTSSAIVRDPHPSGG